MKCENTDLSVKELFEQCAGPEAHRVLHEHLAACPECRKRHADTFMLLESVYAIELPYPPAGLASSVMAGIRNAEGAASLEASLPAMAPGRVLRLDAMADSGKKMRIFPTQKPANLQEGTARAANLPGDSVHIGSDRREVEMSPGILPFPGHAASFSGPATSGSSSEKSSDANGRHENRYGFRSFAAAAAVVLALFFFRGISFDAGKNARVSTTAAEVAGSSRPSEFSACRVYSFSGTFQHHDGLRWNPGSISTQISDGSRIKVGKSSYMTLHFGTVATYLFGPDSLITVHGEGRRISLDAGTLSETVKSGNGTFSVMTPLGTVTVIGTMFDVKVSENGEASVAVREGLVSVRDKRGIARLISKGQAISIKESGIADKPENASLLRPMQEIFIPGVFGAAPETASSVRPAGRNQQNELPEAVRKPVILEKDMKEAKTLTDFLW